MPKGLRRGARLLGESRFPARLAPTVSSAEPSSPKSAPFRQKLSKWITAGGSCKQLSLPQTTTATTMASGLTKLQGHSQDAATGHLEFYLAIIGYG